ETQEMTTTSKDPLARVNDARAITASSDAIAWLIVRIATGLILMPHGAQKLFGWFGSHGLAATGQFFEQNLGLAPGIVFALLAGLTEFVGGLFLAIGLVSRLTALAVVALMGYAAFGVHLGNGFFWTAGGFEYPLLWGLVALAIVIRGGGDYAVDRAIGWKF
ncbi:MAG: DoxX family protein, partial [Hyphomicrobiaceae bacterium]